MENLLLFLATSFFFRLSTPQKIKSQLIGSTGCSALLADEKLQASETNSGDLLYFHEFKEQKVSYGMICVQMKEEYSLDEATEMLVSYIEQLRGPFYALYNTGSLEDKDWNSTGTRTIVDYWQDYNKKDWKVKGYTNGKVLAVLYVKNISQVEVSKQDLFLDSFHFNAAV